MKYLLLGGAGFIGQHLAKKLMQEGHEVLIIDSLVTSIKPSFECNFIHADITKIDIEEYIASSDVVYFLAGSVGVSYIVERPYETTVNNVALALKVAPLVAKHKKLVLFASTSEVYGDGPFHENANLSIGCSSKMRWSYASAKLTTEFIVASSGAPYRIIRFFNTVGPGQLANYGMVLPRFIQAATQNKDIIVYDTGEQRRSFCHVKESVGYITQLEKAKNGIYNVGSDKSITINELANKVKEITGSSSKIVHRSIEDVFGENGGDIYERVPDLTKLKQTINYQNNYNIEDIIRDILND